MRLLVLVLMIMALAVFAPFAKAADPLPAEINNLRVQRAEDGLFLSVGISFELPSTVESALLKGVPMTFVMEAEVLRDRWYWYDKIVATASRSVRIAFQPLTRRWRVGVTSGTHTNVASGIALTQSFETLDEALLAVRRVARWKIADAGDIDMDVRHNVDFRFRLDLTQLPRPLQIGVLGQADWNISGQRNARPETP